MSYVTYTTKGLVCGSFEQNTSDKSFLIFSREAGMLYATARSVREESSKQRCALQDFSEVQVSLVKGKSGWRVGSVEVQKNNFSLANDRETRGSVAAVYRLLRRYIRGEEAFPDLYDFTVSALDELLKKQENRRFLDLFVQMRILFMLGYVDKGLIPKSLREGTLQQASLLHKDISIKQLEKIVAHANDSSHL